jgi:hypothetical protein
MTTWRDRFRNEFGNYGLFSHDDVLGYEDAMGDVESFISQERRKAVEEAFDMLDECSCGEFSDEAKRETLKKFD